MKQTILIVDDMEINRAVGRLIFEDRYEVLEADSGEACLQIEAENPRGIDVVLLNLDMPGVSGLDILRLRREGKIFHNIPVIVLTASEDAASQIKAFELGAVEYITIPFVKEIAEFRVNNVLFFAKQLLALEQQKEHFLKKSEQDLMTGLYNKETSRELVETALAQYPCGVLFIFDIDSFKQFNDSYGHAYGDRVICETAAFIRRQFRSCDIVGRIGGDEFIAYMSNVTPVTAIHHKAEAIVANLHDSSGNGLSKDVSLSIGVACVRRTEGVTFEQLYRAADEALYEVKRNGKNGYVLHCL